MQVLTLYPLSYRSILFMGLLLPPPKRENHEDPQHFACLTLCTLLSRYSLQPGFISEAKTDFQYILAAATSLGTKVGAETLTYLNQGIVTFIAFFMAFCSM
ncbi:hypothetical protein AVEN_6328-1 [Araneus ventricosus]|uniref:Grh/CP2 DB domain-containing protein n=1 Tax=Araneus ventricosus TaxID=182803 RepID=A0A4Y2GT48_ARAVE|nr:hypothetical protein AVEN_6328-1 [Araneus ventricosus]